MKRYRITIDGMVDIKRWIALLNEADDRGVTGEFYDYEHEEVEG